MNKDVIAQLAFAARANLLQKEAMDKEGRAAGQWLMRNLSRPFTRSVMQAERLPAGFVGPPRMVPTRVFSGGRTAATLGGTAAVGGLAYDQAAHDAGDSWNPLRRSAHITAGTTINPWTWSNPNTHQQAFSNARDRFNRLNDDLNRQIDAAYASGNLDEANRLQQMQDDQSFAGGSSAAGQAFARWNPFGGGSMAQYGQAARAQIDPMQRQLEGIRRRMTQRAGQLSPEQTNQFNEQINALDTRLREGRAIPDIRARMGNAPAGGPTSSAPTPAAPHWAMGGRGGNPFAVQGWALNPYDVRRDPSGSNVWEDVLARSGPARPI